MIPMGLPRWLCKQPKLLKGYLGWVMYLKATYIKVLKSCTLIENWHLTTINCIDFSCKWHMQFLVLNENCHTCLK